MGSAQQALLSQGGASSYTGTLDSYSSGMFACGGRKRLLGTWGLGALYDAKDTTTSTVYTVSAKADGTEDTAAMVAGVGSHSAIITKVYDQSGSGNHFAPSTGGREPLVITAGSLIAYIAFDGVDDDLICANNGPGSNAAWSIAMSRSLGSYTSKGVYEFGDASTIGAGAGFTQALQEVTTATNNTVTYIGSSAGSGYTQDSSSLSVDGRVVSVYTPAGSPRIKNYLNGTLTGTVTNSGVGSSTGNFAAAKWRLGRRTDGFAAQIALFWFAIWTTDQSGNGVAISSLSS